MNTLIAGWLIVVMYPFLPGGTPEVHAKIHSTPTLCGMMQESFEQIGAHILQPCRYVKGDEYLVLQAQ